MTESRPAEARTAETRKVLEMLHAHQVSVEQALELLAALGAEQTGAFRPPAGAKMIRLVIETEDEPKVRLNVPLPLAKFALQFVPKDVRSGLEEQGLDLAGLLGALEGDLPEGRLVDIETGDDKQVRVVVDIA